LTLSHARATSGSQSLLEREMQLDLTDEEAAALLRELNNIIENDRYPLSPRIRMLRGIRAKLPGARHRNRLLRDRRDPKNEDQGERHALAGRDVRGHALRRRTSC
jgi:hypothetical protein